MVVEGELELSIDGVPASLTAHGRHLRLQVHRPVRLLRGLRLRTLARLAARLDRLGLTLHLVGRRRTLLVLGRGVSSRLGRWLLRSPYVGFGHRSGNGAPPPPA
jgi:hypothetical protein